MTNQANIPMQTVGPIKIVGPELTNSVDVPLATFETPLWPSVNRGAKISQHGDGITIVVTKESMTRSIAVEAHNAIEAQLAMSNIVDKQKEIQEVVATTSRFAKLIDVHAELVGRIIYLRFAFTTGDASGHNMVTLACEKIQDWILSTFTKLKYITLSANFCTDKKVSAVNGILGRGKSVTAEMIIPRKICKRFLKTTPEIIVDLHIKKNLIGSTLAGSLRSANAHFANMLLAFYLATGQDAANIIEGSQGIVHTEVDNGDLYFSVNLPNIIVGSIGNGKDLDFVRENLTNLGCLDENEPGINARKLAIIAAATVWCGELSLLGALANQGELMQSHIAIERKE